VFKKGGELNMPLSLRIPPEKEKMIKMASKRAGKTKSAFIVEAIDEKLGLVKNRKKNNSAAGRLADS
jgi:predicted DNA-binding protein